MKICFVCSLLVFRAIMSMAQETTGVRPVSDEPSRCEDIKVRECTKLGYNVTHVPNLRGHTNQNEAENELRDFLPLAINKCSNAILHFLCGFYVPACFIEPDGTIIVLKPCQNLCKYITPGCKEDLEQASFTWPTFFNCSLETFSNKSSCFGPDDLMTVTIPELEFITTSGGRDMSITTAKSIAQISSHLMIILIACLTIIVTLIASL